VFSRTAERADGKIGEGLLAAAEHDVKILRGLFRQDIETFCEPLLKNYRPTNPGQSKSRQNIRKFFLPDGDMTDADAVQGLCRHYRRYGYGPLADYMAFKWDEKERRLVGVNSCDNITFDGLIGYERQKRELIGNTEAFLQGLPANNVLLFGERGAGKSSSVKALINKFFDDGLRLVEIPRPQFAQLPSVMGSLKNWGKKFVLYLDDLSFEEFEVEYKQLKSIIDGGIEVKPGNVLIYATSNRRNIVKEVWADNEGDELHRSDTINEKVSLADRFGVKIFFPSPNQEAYFKIITALAARAGLGMGEEELRREAVKWEMSHTGRSGRIASQLVAYLLGRRETKAGDN
jgi:predicted AAA+ superfamily ATPase